MNTQESQIQGLAAVALPNLVGKTIKWSAPYYRGNHPYGGVCTITHVDMGSRRPITATTLEGDDIQFGFQDETTEGFIDYSDSGRTISFEIIN